jgi:putative PIN family toxin of toxin-antitoxin system
MISAVVDTNVMVRGAITSHPSSASKGVIDAIFSGSFLLLLSTETLLEIQRVLADEMIRAVHNWSDEKILDFCRALEVQGRLIETTTIVSPSLTRDITDTKLVALAIDGKADYLVTLDRRHLGRLKVIEKTKILTPAKFLGIVKAGY